MKNALLKTEGICKASPDDTLSTVLSQLTTSHDAAFIFDNKQQYLGVINPYYTLIQSSYPPGTKVEHCLFHPPRIKTDDDMKRIAEMMIESRVHFLPVFNADNSFEGITTAYRLLQELQTEFDTKVTLQTVLNSKRKLLVYIYETDSVGKAMSLYKKYKVSKLIVINKQQKLRGIISYYDLIPYLIAPGRKNTHGNRTGEKVQFHDLKVKNFMKTSPATADAQTKVHEAIDNMIQNHIGSVVVTDAQNHPVGLVTTRDLLKQMIGTGHLPEIKISYKDTADNKDIFANDLEEFLQNYIQKRPEFKDAQLVLAEKRDGKLFGITVHLHRVKGDPTVLTREGHELADMIKDIKHAITNLHSS